MFRIGFLDDLPRQRKRKRVLLVWAIAMAVVVISLLCLILFKGPGIRNYLFLSVAILALGVSHVIMRRPEDGVPILMYHSVSDDPAWLPWAQNTSVSVERFRSHLDMIKRSGLKVISNRDFVKMRLAGEPVPNKSIILHFDDGYLDNWVAVAPLLADYNIHGTIFVSTDFVDMSADLRPQLKLTGTQNADALNWAGYANWPELRAMDQSEFIDVESHGVDHTRVFTSERVVDTLSDNNWKRYAWLEWARMEGNKSTWFSQNDPLFWSYGDTIYENDSALSAREYRGGEFEAEASFDQRVEDVMETSKRVLSDHLGREPEIFCWPFNRSTLRAHHIALNAGYLATTNGIYQNRPQDDPKQLARINVSARLAGIDSVWLDTLILRGSIGLFRGNHYWMFLVLGAGVLRKIWFKHMPVSQA